LSGMKPKSERHDAHTELWWESSEFRGFIDCNEIVLTLKQSLKNIRISKTYFPQIKKETNCNI
jgi:hypothetical protein